MYSMCTRAPARGVVHSNADFSMNFWIFLAGCAIVIGGVAWGLAVAGVGTTYVLIASVIMLGLAILTAVTRTRTKDSTS
jgi:hypothetical protein